MSVDIRVCLREWSVGNTSVSLTVHVSIRNVDPIEINQELQLSASGWMSPQREKVKSHFISKHYTCIITYCTVNFHKSYLQTIRVQTTQCL